MVSQFKVQLQDMFYHLLPKKEPENERYNPYIGFKNPDKIKSNVFCQMKLIHWIRLFIYILRISSQVDVLQTEGHNPQLCADI